VDAGNFDEISDWWSLEERPTAYYRTAAARARRLEAEATTLWLKQYLGEVIARCERLAEEIGKDIREGHPRRTERRPARASPHGNTG
jgi:hypothetical protein